MSCVLEDELEFSRKRNEKVEMGENLEREPSVHQG